MINRLETKLRKGAAAILAFCVASTSCMGNAFAAVREAEEDDEIELVECVIDLDWEKLEESIEDAIRSNRILKDESDFFFVSDDADTVAQYRQLLAASKENPLYTVDYKFKKKDLPDKTSIQLFVRRDGNAGVTYDDRSWEAELTDGDEDQEFPTATPAQAADEQGNDVSGGTQQEAEEGSEAEGRDEAVDLADDERKEPEADSAEAGIEADVAGPGEGNEAEADIAAPVEGNETEADVAGPVEGE